MKLKHAFFLLSTALVISIFGCKKEDDQQGLMDFKFIGAHDTSLVRGTSVQRSLQLYYLGGQIESVAFSDSGLPNGVTATYDPATLTPDGYVSQTITATATSDTGTYTIKLTGTSEGGKTYSRYYDLTITREPNALPVIILTGSGNLIHTLNEPYTEPGYQATDLEDGNITANVQVTGSVDVNQTGLYQITYSVTDNAGQTVTLVRKVTVQNSLNYLNGQFTCSTTDLGNSTTRNWITSISVSTTVNNQFTIFKLSDCYQANPLTVYVPAQDSMYVNQQTFFCITPIDTDTLTHTFQGAGTIQQSGGISTLTLFYTDSFTDIGGTSYLLNKKDIYVK